MDYDSVKKAGSSVGTGAVIVMDETTCMVRALRAPGALLHVRVLRPMHALPRRHRLAGSHAEAHHRGRGPQRGSGASARCGQSHRGPHHLRAGRCGRLARAEFLEAFPARVSVHDRAQGPLDHRRARCRRRHKGGDERRSGQYRSQRCAAEGPQGPDDHAGHGRGRHLYSALLLSRETHRRRQLPHVPGRGGKGAEADAGLRDAGHGRHEGVHEIAEEPSPRSARPWNSC